MEDQDPGVVVQRLELGREIENVVDPRHRKAELRLVDLVENQHSDPPEQRVRAGSRMRVLNGEEEEVFNRS